MDTPEPVLLSSLHSPEELSDVLSSRSPWPEDLEAVCARLNIRVQDLRPKPLSHFHEEGVSPEVQELRFQHNEKKRLYRLEKVLQEAAAKRTGSNVFHLTARNRSQDVRRLFRDTSPAGRYGAHSVSPSALMGEQTPTPRDVSEMSSTEVSVHDKQRTVHERRIQAQERALKLRISDLEEKIAKLQEKETRFEQVREELRATEAEKQRKRDQRSSKIKENLVRKYRAQEQFEKQEARRMKQLTPDLRASRNRGSFVPTVSRVCLKEESEDEETERQMQYINEKLEESAQRASQIKHLKALSLAAKLDQFRRAKARVEAEEAEKQQELLKLALKLKQQQERSSRLRKEHLEAVIRKRAEINRHKVSNKTWTKESQSSPLDPSPTVSVRAVDPLKAEKAVLKRKDIAENRSRELHSLKELKESILWKHRTIADTLERRSHERSSLTQSLLREDFQRQARRDQLLKSAEFKLKDLHSRYFHAVEVPR